VVWLDQMLYEYVESPVKLQLHRPELLEKSEALSSSISAPALSPWSPSAPSTGTRLVAQPAE